MKKHAFGYTLAGIIFVSILGTLLHFVYDWSGKNFIAGLFSPVNESTWEHMKLLFFPMLVYVLWEYKRRKEEYPHILAAGALGILAGTLAVPVIFYTYTGILGGHTLFLDIATFYASVIIAFLIRHCSLNKDWLKEFKTWILFSAAILFIMFLLFTYFPPDLGLFSDPQ